MVAQQGAVQEMLGWRRNTAATHVRLVGVGLKQVDFARAWPPPVLAAPEAVTVQLGDLQGRRRWGNTTQAPWVHASTAWQQLPTSPDSLHWQH